MGIIYNLWNNVRSSALWSLAIAVIYVGTSVALLELGVNMTAFLIIGAVAAIMQGAVLHIAIYSHIYPQSMPKVYVRLWRCCAYFALVFGLSFAIDYFINASNLFTLLVEGVLALLVALCVAPIFINAEDLDALDVILPIKTVMRWLNFNWTRQNA